MTMVTTKITFDKALGIYCEQLILVSEGLADLFEELTETVKEWKLFFVSPTMSVDLSKEQFDKLSDIKLMLEDNLKKSKNIITALEMVFEDFMTKTENLAVSAEDDLTLNNADKIFTYVTIKIENLIETVEKFYQEVRKAESHFQ